MFGPGGNGWEDPRRVTARATWRRGEPSYRILPHYSTRDRFYNGIEVELIEHHRDVDGCLSNRARSEPVIHTSSIHTHACAALELLDFLMWYDRSERLGLKNSARGLPPTNGFQLIRAILPSHSQVKYCFLVSARILICSIERSDPSYRESGAYFDCIMAWPWERIV